MPEPTDPAIRQTVLAARAALARVGVEGPDAELLAAHVLGASRAELQLRMARGEAMPASSAAELGRLVARRGERVPLQHLTGTAPFRTIELVVGPGVFVPRPETEGLVDLALARIDATGLVAPLVVDAGSGSGAIALAIATERPATRVVAVERSDDAVVFTRENAGRIAPSVTVLHGDLADLGGAVAPELHGAVDVLVSNPPYVPDDAVPVDPEVRDHDPAAALYGGTDGLDVVRTLARVGHALVRRGGSILIEHGELQGRAVLGILGDAGWHDASTHPDLTGRDRVTLATR